MNQHRSPIRVITAVLVGAIASLSIATAVSAHTPVVSATCFGGLSVGFTKYEAAPGAALNNLATITIDGVVSQLAFDVSAAQTFPWDPTANHVWTVVLDANRINGNATQFDRSFSGTMQACVEQSTTTTIAPTTTTTVPGATTTVVDTTTTVPVVTTASTTTTVSVGNLPPVPPPSTSVGLASSPPTLPRTGRPVTGLLVTASVACAIGLVLLRVRRRTPARSR